MATTRVKLLENIRIGYNPIIYFGADLDMDAVGSPITAANTRIVHRPEDGARYVPGGAGNDFTTLTSGFERHGGRYVIVAKEAFLLHCTPGEVTFDV